MSVLWCECFQALESVCNPILNKPKPKVEPPKEEKKNDGSANNSAGAGGDPTLPDSSTDGPIPPAGDQPAKTGDMEVD
jgi:heat shock protein 4